MNTYELSRNWFDWSFENPEKVSPNHSAIYFFAIEHCNRLGWKEKFGFPTQMAMDALGIKNHNTYTKYFNDLVDWGFFKMVQKSKNQYSANIIAISSATSKNSKALSRASYKHTAKQVDSTPQSIDSIDKPNNLQPINQLTDSDVPPSFVFKTAMLQYGFEEKLIDDWIKVRKTKRATNTETAYELFIKEVEKTGKDKNEILKMCVEKSWSGFKNGWEIEVRKNQPNGKSDPYPVKVRPKFDITKAMQAASFGSFTGGQPEDTDYTEC